MSDGFSACLIDCLHACFRLRSCFLASLLVCLLTLIACWLIACLLACIHACLMLASYLVCLHACMYAYHLLDWLRSFQSVPLLACLLACLLEYLFTCLLPCLQNTCLLVISLLFRSLMHPLTFLIPC